MADNALDLKQPVREHLKDKSRRRRDGLARLSAPGAAPRALREDVLPGLKTTFVPLDDLRSPAREVRKTDLAHVMEVAGSISALGFCVPILIGKNNAVIDGVVRLEATKLLGLDCAPCVRIDHLSKEEQRVLRLAVNRHGEKGEWNFDELKIEFEELILEEAPIEVSGFSLAEIDQIVVDDELYAAEQGRIGRKHRAAAIARLRDVFQLGPHRLICGDARDPAVLKRLMGDDPPARLILTDEPYNKPKRGFPMARGEMSAAKFLDFNLTWIEIATAYLRDGGVFGTFID